MVLDVIAGLLAALVVALFVTSFAILGLIRILRKMMISTECLCNNIGGWREQMAEGQQHPHG